MGISWLHISDFHIKAAAYDQDVVLRALVQSVADYRQRGEHAPDLVFATGDIAHSGQKSQYDVATKFFDALLAALELPKSRLFVIPGNHDVDRTKGMVSSVPSNPKMSRTNPCTSRNDSGPSSTGTRPTSTRHLHSPGTRPAAPSKSWKPTASASVSCQ